MAIRCAGCGTENPSRFRFCGECGSPLTATPDPGATAATGSVARPATAAPAGPATPPAAVAANAAATNGGASPTSAAPETEGERRQLTILFCDLVGSAEIAHRLDPEEWREVIRAYQQTCTDVVTSFGGHVARYVGDALKVYFGYPHAHADDAVRALRAALALVESMPAFNERVPGHAGPLQVRVGVHTGLVVTGDVAGEKYERDAAIGETPNIAARLQSLADPDSVLISGATRRLVHALFELEDRGTTTLRGIGEPMQVYRALGENPVAGSFDGPSPADLTPLAGRDRELGVILDRWQQARSGRGQVVLISGEAGIGKSRLLQALRGTIEAPEPSIPKHQRWLVCRCYPDTQSSALFPIIQLLRQELGFESDDSPELRLEKLQQSLTSHGQAAADTVAMFASLLSLPVPKPDALSGYSADVQKRRTMEAMLGWLLALARQQPLVVVAEDLHWAHPSSLEFLTFVLKRIEDVPILTLLTRRPEHAFPLAVRANVREIKLSRLAPEDANRIVDSLTDGRRLPREVVDQIVAKTDGVPLFVEELVKMVLESGLLVEQNGGYSLSGSLPPLAIPSTLQDSLMERLDRLGTAKEIAQLASVVGREFSDEMLETISGKDEASLRQALDRLVVAGLIQPYSSSTYVFRHALIQETAYQSLLRSRRQLIHRQVADALVNRFRDVVTAHPELVAYHYAAAGLAEPALQYWLQAGQRASRRSAFQEALMHLHHGLDVLASMPESIERMRYELQLQVSLGDALIAVSGYGAPQVGEAYARARELCQSLGEEPQLGLVLGGVWVYYLIRADYRTALELAQQLLRLSEQLPVPMLIAGAHTAVGATLMNLGDLATARDHLEKAAEYGERDQLVLASDLRVSALCFLANVLAALGETDRAIRRVDQAVERARDLGKPFFLANALTQSAWVRQLARDVDGAGQAADAAVALSIEQGFPYWQAFCLMTQGWVRVEQGNVDEGLDRMMRSQSVAKESGTERAATSRLATLAEGYLRAGRFEDALQSLARAFAHLERTGERFCEAELHRLRGEVLARGNGSGSLDEARSCFHTARELGRRQGARLWELRAEASLERLGATGR